VIAKLEPKRVRTLFLSDVHLGTRGSQASKLIAFLQRFEADTIYLVGDILDGWRLKEQWYWPQDHNDLVQKLLMKIRDGARIVYLPGNHDEFLRDFLNLTFGRVQLIDQTTHTTADGKTYLILHGDQFDVVVKDAPWLAHLGDWAYRAVMKLNGVVNFVRRRLGKPYWSLSAWAKNKVKNAVNAVGRFETVLSEEARKAGAHGIICGHIHHAADRMIGDVRYLNTGDWVESCTALIEEESGEIRLVRYADLFPAAKGNVVDLPVSQSGNPRLA
jgi:UDP-2,3-diacylglucosamine pyrophosphatase LpxH